MIPGLSLIGEGSDSCWIDARSFAVSGSVVIAMKDSCLIKGFYILASNNFEYGYGIYTFGQTGLITQNKFSHANTGIFLNNTKITTYKNHCYYLRTGITVSHSNSLVRKNEIFKLTEEIGTGIDIIANTSNYKPIIDSNYIETISLGIEKGPGTKSTIKNNEIKLIGGSTGISLSYAYSDSNYVFNNKVYAGSSVEGIYCNGFMNLQLYNNYVTGNIGDAVTIRSSNVVKNNIVTKVNKGIISLGSGIVFQYNDVWDNYINYTGFTPDTTNLSLDPMVVNNDSTQGKLDFHLQMFSPLIDAGDSNILDKDGTRSDIGLYGGPYGESYVYVDLPPRTPVNLTASVDSNIVTLRWNKNTEADFSYYKIFYDTTKNFQIDSTKLISSQPDTFYYFVIPAGAESLYFKLTSVDNQGNESNPSEELPVILVSVINEWKPVNNYILYQNYPNPFNPSTKIGYKLKERGYVKLYVYDVKGELVTVLVNQTQEAGYYEVEFSTEVGSGQSAVGGHSGEVRNLASGVYIYQIFVSNENRIPVFSDIKKMLLIK
jgi:hypothetical protein